MYVKIKTWDEMEKEYGLNKYGGINTKYNFTKKIEKILPEDRIIKISQKVLDAEDVLYYWKLEDDIFFMSKDMIINDKYIDYLNKNNLDIASI
jgi:hypothetical protein